MRSRPRRTRRPCALFGSAPISGTVQIAGGADCARLGEAMPHSSRNARATAAGRMSEQDSIARNGRPNPSRICKRIQSDRWREAVLPGCKDARSLLRDRNHSRTDAMLEKISQAPGRLGNASDLYDWDELVQEDRVHRLIYTDPA